MLARWDVLAAPPPRMEQATVGLTYQVTQRQMHPAVRRTEGSTCLYSMLNIRAGKGGWMLGRQLHSPK